MKLQIVPLSTDRQLTRLDSTIPINSVNAKNQKKRQKIEGIETKNQKAKQGNVVKDTNTKSDQKAENIPNASNNRCRLILVLISFMVILSCSITVLILSIIDKKDGFISIINSISFPAAASTYINSKYTVNNYTSNLKSASLALASCIVSALVGLVVLILKRAGKVFTCRKSNELENVSPAQQNNQKRQPLLNKAQLPRIQDQNKLQQLSTNDNENKQKEASLSQQQGDLLNGTAKFLILLYSWILLGLIVALGHHLSFFLDWKQLNSFDIDEFKLYLFIGLQALSLIYTSVIYVMVIHYFRLNQQGSNQNEEKQELFAKQQVLDEKKKPKELQIKNQTFKKDQILLSHNNGDNKGDKLESNPEQLVQKTKQTTKQNPKDTTETKKQEQNPVKTKQEQTPKFNPFIQSKVDPTTQNKVASAAQKMAPKDQNKIIATSKQQKEEKPKQNNKQQLLPNHNQKQQQPPSKNSIKAPQKITNGPQNPITETVSGLNNTQPKINSPKLNESPTVLNLNPSINTSHQDPKLVNVSQLSNATKTTNNPKEVSNAGKVIDKKQQPINQSLTRQDDGIKNDIQKNNYSKILVPGKDNTLQKQTLQLSIPPNKPIDKKTDPVVVQPIKTSTQTFVLKPLVDLPKPNENVKSSLLNQDKAQKHESVHLAGNHFGQKKLENSSQAKNILNTIKNQLTQNINAKPDQAHIIKPELKQNLPNKQQPPPPNQKINEKPQKGQISHSLTLSNPHEPIDINHVSKVCQNQQPFPQTKPEQNPNQNQQALSSIPLKQTQPSTTPNPPLIQPSPQHQQTHQKPTLPNQKPSKKRLSFCSGIYSIQQSSPFSTMVSNVFKSKSHSKQPHPTYEDLNLTPITNTDYYNHSNHYPQRHAIRQEERFQTNRIKKFDVENQVETSPINQRFSPTNRKVVMQQQHISSQKFFKTPSVKVPQNTRFNQNHQNPFPERRLVPLKQQVYDPYGYQSLQKNTNSQVSSYQSGAQFYHNSIKKQIKKSGNRIWNHSTAYSTDNELVKRKNPKFEQKSPSSGTQISYYDKQSFKKHKSKGQQKMGTDKSDMKQVDSVKDEQLQRIKQEQAKIQQIYLESQRRIQNKINMLNASIQQKQLDSKLIEQSIKFMNQTNFNSVLNPVIDQNKKLRLIQQQQRIEDERQEQQQQRQLKLNQEKLLRLKQQQEMKEKQRLLEGQRKLSGSRGSKQSKLGRKREGSSRELVRDKSGVDMSKANRNKSKQVSRQTFSNGQPSITITKDPNHSSNHSSNSSQPLPTKQQLQIRYLQRLQQLGDIQSPSLNAYMERVLYKRRNSENNFNNNGFEPVWVKVEKPSRQTRKNIYTAGEKKELVSEYKRLDFVLLTPQSGKKKKNQQKKQKQIN